MTEFWYLQMWNPWKKIKQIWWRVNITLIESAERQTAYITEEVKIDSIKNGEKNMNYFMIETDALS